MSIFFFKDIIWSYVFIPLFIIAGAVSVVFKLKWRDNVKVSTEGGISPIKTLFVNLGATIGTGNIAGVSMALLAGGPGSIFWMWTAALMGMCVSYTENVLGVVSRKKNKYPIPYMTKGAAIVFSVFCILASFGMGNMVQSNCAANAAKSLFKSPKWLTGIVMGAICFLVIFKGIGGIVKFTDKWVPVMGTFYIISAVCVIYVGREMIIPSIISIFKEALKIKSIFGGTMAAGIARGIFSGEAGLGSAVILSSQANVRRAKTQGNISMLAIFIDTMIICTVTALCILTTGAATAQGAFYKTLGVLGGKMLDLSTIFFAFTTIVGWSCYGACCIKFICGDWGEKIYRAVFVAAVFVGAVAGSAEIWGISDLFNAAMAIPNLLFVIKRAVEYLKLNKNRERSYNVLRR